MIVPITEKIVSDLLPGICNIEKLVQVLNNCAENLHSAVLNINCGQCFTYK